jgi:hypothetical protein
VCARENHRNPAATSRLWTFLAFVEEVSRLLMSRSSDACLPAAGSGGGGGEEDPCALRKFSLGQKKFTQNFDCETEIYNIKIKMLGIQ